MLNNERNGCRHRGVSAPSARAHSATGHDSSSHARIGGRQTYKLAIPERCSSSNNGDSRSGDTTKAASPSTMSLSASRTSALETLRRTLRKHKSQRKSISTTGTSVITVCNEDEEEEQEQEAAVRRRQQHHHQQHDDDDEDIAILQPEEDTPASPEKRVHRWRRSISSMRMALSRSSSSSGASSSSSGSASSSSLRRRNKKASPTMYSISFYPWKRDPRAYYSNPEAAAEWVPDTASKRCQICLASFHFARRRHHCRICGLLACNDCSLQRTFFPFTKGSRSQHHLIKDGAPQRTCNACAGTLKNMAAQHDPRVKQFTADALVTDPFGMRDDGDDDFSGATAAQDDASRSCEPETWRVGNEEIYVIDSSKSKSQHQIQLLLGGGSSASAPQTQADELDEVLRARAQSRKNPQPKYYVVSSVWLEQWLQFVHIDASISSHGVPSRKHRAASTRRATPRHVRRPGPITNYALLNFVSGKLVPKDGLERSRGNDAGGDYRIVSEEVWSVFVRLYGGGPCIQLRMGDPESSEQLQALVRTHSGHLKGSSSGTEPTDASHWVIVELDDSIPALIASEPADLLKGNRNMRRAASTSSLRHCPPSKSMKHLSSVHPFHETAPCVLGDAAEWLQPQPPRATPQRHDTTSCILSDASDRAQPYYPRDSIVNCITSPPAPVASRKTARPQKRAQVQHQSLAPVDVVPQDRPLAAREWTNALLSGSAVHERRRGSVGTVLFAPAQSSSDSASKQGKIDASPRETIAAVSAFAVAATEARKKSAMSLSRHSSTLSSTMARSSAA